MRKEVIIILALTLVLGLCWGAGAQIVPENHYLVYEVANPYTVDISVTLFDQFDEWFGDFSTNSLALVVSSTEFSEEDYIREYSDFLNYIKL